MPNQDFRETLLHELQHYIQNNEGWQNGGLPSPEMGLMYADALENKVDPTSPMAEQMSALPQAIREQSGEIMPFMQNEAMGIEMAGPAYLNITGEQLARDATERDKSGAQVVDYYDGPITGDGDEYVMWHYDDPTYMPARGSMNVRNVLQNEGLLGPYDFATGALKAGEKSSSDPLSRRIQIAAGPLIFPKAFPKRATLDWPTSLWKPRRYWLRLLGSNQRPTD